MTGFIGDEIYGHLKRSRLLQNEQKGCCRVSRGTKNQLLIDKRNCRKGKEKSSHRIYRLQENVRHGTPFLVKSDTENSGSSRQHSPIIRSEHA